MKTKIIGIFLCMLLIATALPVIGITNKEIERNMSPVQSSGIEWEKTYGGSEADKLWDVQETDDNGYIACGTTETSHNHCPWILRVDSEGNEIWNWTITEFYYNDTYFNITYCWLDNIKPTTDGGCIAGITTFRFFYNHEEHEVGGLVKLDSNGEEEWMQIYGDPFDWGIMVEDIAEVEDGFIGVGSHGPTIIGYNWDYSACMFKTDSSGDLIWNQTYNYGPRFDFARGFCYADDGFVIVGNFGTSVDSSDAFMVKTDSNGNEEWNKAFGGPGSGHDYFDNVFLTTDGGYIMCGWSKSFGDGSYDAWLLKTDTTGKELWNKTFGESKSDLCYGDFDSTDDGGYIIPISIDSAGMNTDGWALKVDSDGNAEWKHIYGEAEGKQFFIGICSTSDTGCIASGIVGAWDSSGSDALLVKYGPFPQLDIEIIGGLGFKTTITNNGLGDAIDVPYEVTVTGGLLGLINKTINGTINIEAGESETISTGLLLGIGGIEIVVTVGVKEESAEGMQLFIFTLV
jgi:hypothetical protein